MQRHEQLRHERRAADLRLAVGMLFAAIITILGIAASQQ
jgi:uncharacterized protein (UPF0333 family)